MVCKTCGVGLSFISCWLCMRVHKYNEDNNDFENVDWKGISIFVRFGGKGENER